MKKYSVLFVGFVALFVTLNLSSCSQIQEKQGASISDASNVKLQSRAAKEEVYPEIYNYPTVVSFAKGDLIGTYSAPLEDKQVSLCVVYDNDTPWAEVFKTGNIERTGSYEFNQLLGGYDLSINNQFQIDGYNECIILNPNSAIEDIAKVCKEISVIDHVLVVHVKEWPSVKQLHESTAAATTETTTNTKNKKR